ncbi:MAG: MBL fold metallo-hydrolase [Candidatus Glassbacteria bacterium]|nr:MBL fold metallo-hydrolase [Candidatus Glassbacteria bacterium]
MDSRNYRRFSRFLPALAVWVLAASACGPQPADEAGPVSARESVTDSAALPGPVLELREHWVGSTLDWVAEVLSRHPPGTGDPGLRRLALTTLDDPLHLHQAPEMEAVGEFFTRSANKALDQAEAETVASGAKVWKLYNHTFVVKTSRHTFAFDVYRGTGRVSLSREQLERLAGMVEVLFISHYHDDHADYGFAELVDASDGKVVVPGELWQDKSIADRLVRVPGGGRGEAGGLEFTAFPGHQGEDIPNNVYLVSADGVSVMHTGDQSRQEDFEIWINGLGSRYRVDILLPNCWTTDLPEMIRQVDPAVVITGHENELGHTVDHRESFAKTYRHLQEVRHPYVVMNWGERYCFRPAAGRP